MRLMYLFRISGQGDKREINMYICIIKQHASPLPRIYPHSVSTHTSMHPHSTSNSHPHPTHLTTVHSCPPTVTLCELPTNKLSLNRVKTVPPAAIPVLGLTAVMDRSLKENWLAEWSILGRPVASLKVSWTGPVTGPPTTSLVVHDSLRTNKQTNKQGLSSMNQTAVSAMEAFSCYWLQLTSILPFTCTSFVSLYIATIIHIRPRLLILVGKFTDEQYRTVNQSTAGRFDPRVFVNCLQVTLGLKRPAVD